MGYVVRLRRKRRQLLHGLRRWAVGRLGLWQDRPKVLVNSVPKSGTHLLSRCLSLMPGMVEVPVALNRPLGLADLRSKLERVHRGSFVKGHVHFTEKYRDLLLELGFSTFLVLRDPRDVAISLLHWATYKHPRHRLRPFLQSLDDDAERLMAIIKGVEPNAIGTERGLENIADYVGMFLPWMDHGSFVVRFEALIGPVGGGRRDAQIREIRGVAAHLGIDLRDDGAARIAERTFSRGSRTFRRGQIGDWRSCFSERHKEVFKTVAGQLLIDLGYEKNLDW